ncbi:unannotated protein [freshwater metagenome]|uniref:Unannotated protein n=1 Tax=freshwater metagenome TaxID=449393 RepID=A0A6J7EE07_9ZZZZ
MGSTQGAEQLNALSRIGKDFTPQLAKKQQTALETQGTENAKWLM